MPKCGFTDCDSSTPKTRGSAAAEGWRCIDMHGPGGNKYLNACPEHDVDEITILVTELLVRIEARS